MRFYPSGKEILHTETNVNEQSPGIPGALLTFVVSISRLCITISSNIVLQAVS